MSLFKVHKWNGRISISVALATAIGLLIFISVGAVLWIGVWLAQKNTFSLLSTNAHISVTAAANRIIQHLKPSEYLTEFLANRIANGDVDVANKKQLSLTMTGALAAAPQIEAVLFIDTNLQTFGVGQNSQRNNIALSLVDNSRDSIIAENMAIAANGKFWGPPIWRGKFKTTYLNFSHPVIRGGKFIGAIVAVVSVRQLSGFVSEDKLIQSSRRFILYGRDHVLAHPLLTRDYPGRTNDNPLPSLAGFRDPILAAIWQQDNRFDLRLSFPEGTKGHTLDVSGERYVYVYQELTGFGAKPLIVGAYFQASNIGKEVNRMKAALGVAVGALLLSLLAAVFVGRKIAQPIIRIARATSHIGNLDISKINNLSGSVFTELNEQSSAFNSMLVALRWFELYVPKKVVKSLIKQGGVTEIVSDSRKLTIMFTDIAGFSSAAENMPAPQVANLLNGHFALVAKCIAQEDGIVDKFIGDAVMAFWGAPEPQNDSAARACRAALAIAATLRQDNNQRIAGGKPPIHMRIGIHTGAATVGNIGAPDRLNYTVIGDTVNIAQRLEQLGKQIQPEDLDVSILISGSTKRELGPPFSALAMGPHNIKGHNDKVEVYKLG